MKNFTLFFIFIGIIHLCFAAKASQYTPIIKTLLNAGSQAKPAAKSHSEVIELLLKKGQDVQKMDTDDDAKDNQTEKSSSVDYPKVVFDLLIKANCTRLFDKAQIESRDKTIFNEVKILSQEALNKQDPEGNTILHCMALYPGSHPVTSGMSEILAYVLNNGASVSIKNNKGDTPLHCAVRNGVADFVELLIAAKAPLHEVNKKGLTPFEVFILEKPISTEFFTIFARAGILFDLKTDACTKALVYKSLESESLSEGHRAYLVKELANLGHDINTRDKDGNTLLHKAVKADFTDGDLIRPLLLLKADVYARNKFSWTPLHQRAAQVAEFCASLEQNQNDYLTVEEYREKEAAGELLPGGLEDFQNCCEEGTDVLIKAAPDALKATDAEGKTPLHLATERGCYQVVRSLLVHKADPNAYDKSNNTPLHYAVKQEPIERARTIVKTLLLFGADACLKNGENRTAYDILKGTSGLLFSSKRISKNKDHVKKRESPAKVEILAMLLAHKEQAEKLLKK